jgi:protein-L-isoaspartate O-methyltransferase
MARGLDFGNCPELYDAHRPHYRDGLESQIMDLCVERARFIGGTVLEIGLGTGLGTEALLSRDISVVGIEPDERMLAVARQRLGDRLVETGEEFTDRSRNGQAVVRVVKNSFGEAIKCGELTGMYDGVAAFTSIHWAIQECGLEQTSAMIARLLKPQGRLATIHNSIYSYTEKSAQFIRDSQHFWPPTYRPQGHLTDLRGVEDVPPNDFSPHLIPISYDTWAVEEEFLVDNYWQRNSTCCEILELDEDVREQFFADYRALSQERYNGIVPVGRGIMLQIEEKAS